jgi:hypothetical protein
MKDGVLTHQSLVEVFQKLEMGQLILLQGKQLFLFRIEEIDHESHSLK